MAMQIEPIKTGESQTFRAMNKGKTEKIFGKKCLKALRHEIA